MRRAVEPEMCGEYLGRACESGIAHLKQLDQAVGSYCDMLMIAHDMGDSRGVIIGPELWRRVYKPHYRELFTRWHQITRMKVSLHCCGSVHAILDDLIECGVDVYNPVQISASGMDPATLKDKFGEQVIFYGGVFDAVLNSRDDSAERVYWRTRHNIETLSRGGGYLFAGVHNLPADLPESHLQALLQAWIDVRDDPALLSADPGDLGS
jgi:uroporphyrinogen decarboxylase